MGSYRQTKYTHFLCLLQYYGHDSYTDGAELKVANYAQNSIQISLNLSASHNIIIVFVHILFASVPNWFITVI